ncbi:MAG TPA: hypothetical protein VGF28_26700 [Thermoanaerobaculia bacterium]
MSFRRPNLLSLCAPLPALLLGVVTMRQLGVGTSAWAMNLAACVAGLLLFALVRSSSFRASSYFASAASIAAIVATFFSRDVDGVHRWLFLGGFALHAASVVAPLLIGAVATPPRRYLAIVVAAATALLLALQPDASQATSFAAACAVLLAFDPKLGRGVRAGAVVALAVCAVVSLLRPDPLDPVRHVEGIFDAVSARGPTWTLLAAIALVLLPLPFFVAWKRRRDPLAAALGVYVALVTLAAFWGTFPVPVMGYGVSPILGYFIALALCDRRLDG